MKNTPRTVGVKTHLSTIKNAFLCFNTHTYTFQKPYILLTYIIIPLLYSNVLL
jgi:hypothetical protein